MPGCPSAQRGGGTAGCPLPDNHPVDIGAPSSTCGRSSHPCPARRGQWGRAGCPPGARRLRPRVRTGFAAPPVGSTVDGTLATHPTGNWHHEPSSKQPRLAPTTARRPRRRSGPAAQRPTEERWPRGNHTRGATTSDQCRHTVSAWHPAFRSSDSASAGSRRPPRAATPSGPPTGTRTRRPSWAGFRAWRC